MSQNDRPKPKRHVVRSTRPRRPSATRARPTSGMPQGEAQTHALYMEIANLQMTRARQIKIRDALLGQIANCEDEIERADARTAQLLAQIARLEGKENFERSTIDPRRAAPKPRARDDEDASTRSGLTVEDLRSGAFTFKY